MPSPAPPSELLDPDGEGIYLLGDTPWSPLMVAAYIFHGDARLWREIDHQSVWMEPSETGDEWVPSNLGRRPRGWRMNLPRRWFKGVQYVYCTPKP